MRIDLFEAAAAAAARTWDVAVFGSGPAGITVARELAAGGKSVLLCEAGGLEYSEASQQLYHGTESGLPTFDMALKACRLRYFGGTSNHWSGLCGVLDPADFWAQRHHALPGWPIARDEAHAHLAEAARILDLPSADFAPTPLRAGHEQFHLSTVRMSAPTRFGEKYRKELFDSPRIDVALNANLVDLRLAPTPRDGLAQVEHAVVRNYDRRDVPVRARRYVLAMGAIENARLLLASNSQVPAGLGNESDMVGRCYMEHLNIQIGRFVALDPAFFKAKTVLMSPGEALLRQQKIGSGVLSMTSDTEVEDYGRLAPLRRFVRETVCRSDTVRDFARRFKDFNCSGDGVISSMLEQTPDRASRVTLGKESDALGVRRTHLHWVINEADRRSARTLALELAKTVARMNVARIQLPEWVTDPAAKMEVWYHAHQMGTTRVSARPADGVVDAQCRLHTVGNVYLAGSSVFPTGGGINPTLMLVMLAVRLGRHLRSLA